LMVFIDCYILESRKNTGYHTDYNDVYSLNNLLL